MGYVFVIIAAAFSAVLLIVRQRRAPRPFPAILAPLLHLSFWRPVSPAVAAQRHGLQPGMTALELDPGGGYLTSAALDCVSPDGLLICVDVQLGMLLRLRSRLASRTPPLVCGDATMLPFGATTVDLIFLAHVLGETPDPTQALLEAVRVLRSDGILAVTEGLPDPDFIPRRRLDVLAGEAGLQPVDCAGSRFYYTRRFRRTESVA